ncbi:MAG TPA: 50S ribosomal protein L1 [Candidatus Absconditabacterales bacterium]|nr:50S ribosomal protein L1 [Candidatus Absconditabacterales bacterium]HPK28102.1 50S ribosomal protein L1 [Candidatus Absconditabacterales bacterium]
MSKKGKKYLASTAMIIKGKAYPLNEAVELVKKTSNVRFDATVELSVKTNANPKFNDQILRGTAVLPHGTGKTKKIAVFVLDEKLDEAKKSGADIYGSTDLLNNIKNEKIDFDILITTTNSIRELAPVAKQLGPKGLMPSPKAGTVTNDLIKTVEEFKKGKIEFKLDKTGNVHVPVGKVSFTENKLAENIQAILDTMEENKPAGVKGKLIKKVVISSSMGPGILLEYIGK